jgi:hypothetical protein
VFVLRPSAVLRACDAPKALLVNTYENAGHLQNTYETYVPSTESNQKPILVGDIMA